MKKLFLCFFLASITAHADIVSDTIRLVGSIKPSGCNASIPLYRGLEAPELINGLRKVGEITADVKCYGRSKMNMFLVTGKRDRNVYFRDSNNKKQVSSLSPLKFSGEFETEVTLDVLLHRDVKEYDTTVRLVLVAE